MNALNLNLDDDHLKTESKQTAPTSRQAITDFLFLSNEPQAVDLAFVLGAPNLTNIEPAISLYRAGLTKDIVISGLGPPALSSTHGIPEALMLKEYALRCGIPEKNIFTEILSTNTLENFKFSYLLIKEHFGWNNLSSIAICGKPFHMRRALMTARAHWPLHINLLMLPTNHPDDPNAVTWWQSAAGKAHVFKELNAISLYAMKGDIGDF